jgi:hypothetical protein
LPPAEPYDAVFSHARARNRDLKRLVETLAIS